VAKDRFKISLLCPACGKTGEARCEQEDGWAYVKGNTATTVKSVTPGFNRVKQGSYWGDDINFVCDDCEELSGHRP
jgi:hypothetical protein